ncbi:TPA: hypothetical protein PX828_004384 [Escherichia coli]|nr:hypothetical protein [Escherichia coli]
MSIINTEMPHATIFWGMAEVKVSSTDVGCRVSSSGQSHQLKAGKHKKPDYQSVFLCLPFRCSSVFPLHFGVFLSVFLLRPMLLVALANS